MAIINKTGIGEGNLIEAEHITRAIDALSGVSSDTIVATGSFTGSFTGAFNGSIISASYATTSSFAATASFLTGTIGSASFASTSSYVNNLKQNVTITGSLTISGSSTNSLTVQKSAIFNDNVYISGMQYYPLEQVTTTDATQTDVWSYSMSNGEATTIEATILGTSASLSNTDSVGGNLVGVAKCEIGAATIQGQFSSSFDSFGTSPTFGLRRELATNNIHIWVQGLASTTIDWNVSVRKL